MKPASKHVAVGLELFDPKPRGEIVDSHVSMPVLDQEIDFTLLNRVLTDQDSMITGVEKVVDS